MSSVAKTTINTVNQQNVLQLQEDIHNTTQDMLNRFNQITEIYQAKLNDLYTQINAVKHEVKVNFAFSDPSLDDLYAMVPEEFNRD